jgi:hypothetical protein
MKTKGWILIAVSAMMLVSATACDDGGGCATGETQCPGGCVNTLSDANNCGGCGLACGADQICSGGDCVCSSGAPACGTVCCPSGQTCYEGTCHGCADRESCNSIDDDCDGQIDETLTQPCNNACGAGTETCVSGTWANCTAPTPGNEVCDGQDNDCDGQIDEGVSVPLFEDADGDGYGNRDATIQGCAGQDGYADNDDDCDDTKEDVNPDAEEACNDGVDNNCSNAIDEGCTGCVLGTSQNCGEGGDTGECDWGTQRCIDVGDGPEWGECQGGRRPVAETCDGLDNDCDGTSDDGMAGDTYENNETCATARGPLEVPEDGDPLLIDATLYHTDGTQDTDWFIIDNNEAEWDPCIVPWSSECNFYMDVVFAPPSGSDHANWELCLYRHETEDDCGSAVEFEICTDEEYWSATDNAYAFSVGWPGECWFEDGRNYFAVVRRTGSGLVADCHPYALSFQFYFMGEDECIMEE